MMTKQDCPCTNKINSIMIWSCVNVENYFDLFLRSLSEFDAKNGRITNFVPLLLYAKIVKIFIWSAFSVSIFVKKLSFQTLLPGQGKRLQRNRIFYILRLKLTSSDSPSVPKWWTRSPPWSSLSISRYI